MENFGVIWKHEVYRANHIAKILLDDKKIAITWKIILLPVFLHKVYNYKKDLRFTRKNVLFTKRLAFKAAKNIFTGKEYAWEFRKIEIQTRQVLAKEKKGLYTEKIRRKQLSEIELLIRHYRELFNSGQSNYDDIIKESYQSKGRYLTFLSTLHQAEDDAIQAAITTMRKGTKKDRRQWFQRVKEATKKVRMDEANAIFS